MTHSNATHLIKGAKSRLIALLIVACVLLCPPASSANQLSGSGTVAEILNVGNYVYVRLEEDGTWLAATPTPLVVGNVVQYAGGAMMKNFHSSSLDRTFESVLFVSQLQIRHSAAGGSATGESGTAPASPPGSGDIEAIEGGKTIADIYANIDGLKDQPVRLRARVMKVSPNILGKNWITVQDGTGQAPDNKLMVTSLETAQIGDLLTITGVVRDNVTLGAGYNYKALVDEATFSH